MLTKVEVRTVQGTLLTLPLTDISNGVAVEQIDGLDPVKATLVSSSFANMDGEQYHSSRREARNIVFKLGLEPDWAVQAVQDIRRRLYDFFMPKSQTSLRFYMDDGLTVDIAGVVESFETDHFSKEPKVDISVMCFDPDFIDLDPVTVNGNTVSTSTETVVHYDGTVETGIKFVLNVNRALGEFSIYHRPPDNSLKTLEFAASLVSGDVLTINTLTGSKGATLMRTSTETSILYGISPQSNWIELQPGDNRIRVYAEGAAIPFTMEYTPRYGGL